MRRIFIELFTLPAFALLGGAYAVEAGWPQRTVLAAGISTG